MQFEKARLDDALAQMQAIIAEQAKNTPLTPAKEEDLHQREGQQGAKIIIQQYGNNLSKANIPDSLSISNDVLITFLL